MKFLLQISRWIDAISVGANVIALWMALLSTLVSAGNALIRYAFNISSNAWLELQWFMFSILFLLAASYTLKEDGHVRVDVLYGRYKPRTRVWVDLIGALFFLIPFCIVCLITSIPWVMDAVKTLEMSPDAGGLPYWPIKLLLPVAFLLLLLQAVSEVIKRIAMLNNQLPIPGYLSEQALEFVESQKNVTEVLEQRTDIPSAVSDKENK